MRNKIFGGIGVLAGLVFLYLEISSFAATNKTGGFTVPGLLFIGVGLYYMLKKPPEDSVPDIRPEDRYK